MLPVHPQSTLHGGSFCHCGVNGFNEHRRDLLLAPLVVPSLLPHPSSLVLSRPSTWLSTTAVSWLGCSYVYIVPSPRRWLTGRATSFCLSSHIPPPVSSRASSDMRGSYSNSVAAPVLRSDPTVIIPPNRGSRHSPSILPLSPHIPVTSGTLGGSVGFSGRHSLSPIAHRVFRSWCR